jgi:hypothetical protein
MSASTSAGCVERLALVVSRSNDTASLRHCVKPLQKLESTTLVERDRCVTAADGESGGARESTAPTQRGASRLDCFLHIRKARLMN